jgi:hypothetical protein
MRETIGSALPRTIAKVFLKTRECTAAVGIRNLGDRG